MSVLPHTHTHTHTHTLKNMLSTHRMGKTTLLNHIAEKRLTIPPNIDVLLCEQEVVADDTPAIDAVLSADKKRMALLEEEKALMAAGEAGDDSGADRLKLVIIWCIEKFFLYPSLFLSFLYTHCILLIKKHIRMYMYISNLGSQNLAFCPTKSSLWHFCCVNFFYSIVVNRNSHYC